MGQFIQIYNYPRWNDTIHVLTRPSIRDRIYFYRDFHIVDESENCLARATTKWLSINSETRRPYRKDMHIGMDWSKYERFCEKILSKLPSFDDPDTTMDISVKYGDLDVNEHVNQSRYIDWFWESLPLEFHQSHMINEIEILYSSEALYGEQIQLTRKSVNMDAIDFSLIRPIDEKLLCQGRTAWTPLTNK